MHSLEMFSIQTEVNRSNAFTRDIYIVHNIIYNTIKICFYISLWVICISVSFMGIMVPYVRLEQSFKEMMGFIHFWIHEQHFFSKERSNTWPRVRINYAFPSHFKICFRFHISFIVCNQYLHEISIAILAVFTVHSFIVRWIIVQRFIVSLWHIIVYKIDNLLCYILYFRLKVTIIRIIWI